MKSAMNVDSGQPTPKSRRSFFRSFRNRFLAFLSILTIVAVLFVVDPFRIRTHLRFDPAMTTAEAEKIRDKAFETDNAETWLAIHDEILIPRETESERLEWSQVWEHMSKSRSIRDGFRRYDQLRMAHKSARVSFLHRQAQSLIGQYKPNIAHAIVATQAELTRELATPGQLHPAFMEPSSCSLLRMIYENQGRWGDSVDRCWVALASDHSSDWLANGVRLQVLGSYFLQNEDFLKELDKIFARNPGDLWLARFAGVRRWRSGDFAAAEPLLAQAAERFTDDPEGRFAWAESRLALGLPVDVGQIMGPPCRPSIHFETQESARRYFRARLYAKTGDFESARSDAEAAVKLAPRHTAAWAQLAELARKTGDDEKAAQAEAQATEWRTREKQLTEAIKTFGDRIRSSANQPAPIPPEVLEPYLQALRAADWPRPADALVALEKFAAREIPYASLKSLPELQPDVPDRFFQARPVRAKSPEGPAPSP